MALPSLSNAPFSEKLERARESGYAKKLQKAKGFYTLEMAPPSFNEMQVNI
jgi:hypothetical protein